VFVVIIIIFESKHGAPCGMQMHRFIVFDIKYMYELDTIVKTHTDEHNAPFA
jgi:hypothetical protein